MAEEDDSAIMVDDFLNSPREVTPVCFMCRFNHTPNVRTLHTYMVENVSVATPEHMSMEMHATLQRLHPEAEPQSTSQSMCLQHLKHHTLSPVIRIAMMLRSMLHLSDQMNIKLDRLEEDVDLKLVDSFLKLQSQILNVYKTPDVNKLLFADRAT